MAPEVCKSVAPVRKQHDIVLTYTTWQALHIKSVVRRIPLLSKEGGCAIKKIFAKPH